MDDPSITTPPLGGPTRPRRDQSQIETVRRAAAPEDLERAARPERSARRRGEVPAVGWARPAAWMAVGMLSACGFISLMLAASRGTAGARDGRPPGEREPDGPQRQKTPTATERVGFRPAETGRDRGALDDAAPIGRARQPPRNRPALDRACQVRTVGTEAGQERPRRPTPTAGSHRSSHSWDDGPAPAIPASFRSQAPNDSPILL